MTNRINIVFFTIIQLILVFDSTKQSHVRQAIMTFKAIGKTIKSSMLKQIGSTIKNSVNIFRHNKNILCSLQEKYLRTRHNFGSKSVKYLGEEGIKKFKHITYYATGESKQLIRAKGKRNAYMRSTMQLGGKELGSLINMVSKSKPQLPLLFMAGGFNRLTQFSLVPDYKTMDLKLVQEKPDQTQKIKQYHKDNEPVVVKKQPNLEQKDKSRQYYLQNKDKIAQQKIEYRREHQEEIKEYQKKYKESHKEIISKNKKAYNLKNKDKILKQMKEYHLRHKDEISERNKKYNSEHKDTIAKHNREYYLKNKEKLLQINKKYREDNKDKLKERNKERRKLKKKLEEEKKIESEKILKTEDQMNANPE